MRNKTSLVWNIRNKCLKIFVILVTTLLVYVIWNEPQIYYNKIYKQVQQVNSDQSISFHVNKAKETSNKVLNYNQVAKGGGNGNKLRTINRLFYILIWTHSNTEPDKGLLLREAFEDCKYRNCYVTKNRSFFGDNISKFDVVAFNGRSLPRMKETQLPQTRSSHQKYIFWNMEPAENYPICNEVFDGFFNLTMTYKLNSDIPSPYINITDKNGTVVGPQMNMKWLERMDDVEDDLTPIVEKKTKAAAWFVSNCRSRSGRRQFVMKLRNELKQYALEIDEYGDCSSLKCPRGEKKCYDMLKTDYFFYLALENSLIEDYVTEKVLTALQHYTVPIVYGGADYKRFLPQNSYLNAFEYTPKTLAAIMNTMIKVPMIYRQYFRWRRYYEYSYYQRSCVFCAALNNRTMLETRSTYENFREWWHSDFKKRCETYNLR